MSAKDVLRAQAEARDARVQVMDTVEEIKQRLAPRTIAEDVWEGVRDRGTQIAEDAVEIAKARPGAALAVAATTALILARNPIRHAVGSLFGRGGDDSADATATEPPLEGV